MQTSIPAHDDPPRRPIAFRSAGWAKRLARSLTAAGVTPNTISLWSVIFGLSGGIAFAASGYDAGLQRVVELLIGAACIQLRLLANMMDGMVAIEGGKRTAYGELFNDMPDRFADIFFIVGAGYGITGYSWGPALGWVAANLAVLTAYVRLLGASMKTRQYFVGPMAKPHRMGTLTVFAVLATLEPLVHAPRGALFAGALTIIAIGCALTLYRRVRLIVAEIGAR